MTAKNEYQVIARRYRPKCFQDVLGQDPIVATLKNGIRLNRLAHAYLFSGPRGTGKTTLARLLAKAINCHAPTDTLDPCNECSSCREITSGSSLDVIEIDGASNRGIDDIRQINETVGYSTGSGKYKIYIIDEVHMLTKEAFNALLKTLEEPPSTVKFFFATTEPHKVPSTVLSRCQQFHLRHLKASLIVQKLSAIAKDQQREVDEEALLIIATRAEGGLRDAESLFDQILSFHDGKITSIITTEALGMLPQDVFFQLDNAAKDGNLSFAFDIAAQIFNEGKDPARFVETLIEHFRILVLIKLAGAASPCLELTDEIKIAYTRSTGFYHKNQLLSILDLCLESSQTLRFAASPRIALEGMLLKILRSYTKIPLDQLVERLLDLEKRIQEEPPEVPMKQETESIQLEDLVVEQVPVKATTPLLIIEQPVVKAPIEPIIVKTASPINEDPTPKASELPRSVKKVAAKEPPKQAPALAPAAVTPRYDTVLQFAAVELEGKIIKK